MGAETVPVPIAELGLPTRISNLLEQAGLTLTDQLLAMDDQEIQAIRGLGVKSVLLIRESLVAHRPPA